MLVLRAKRCKGTGKAIDFKGCGRLQTFRKRGLGIECKCFSKWLQESEEGKELILKASRKAKMYSVTEERKAKAGRRFELKSYTQKLSEVKTIAQKYARLRDKNEPCISCKTPHSEIWDGGHYKKAELFAGVMFDENNIFKQCRKCNHYLGGNEANYRLGLIEKLGQDKVEELELRATQTRVKKWTDSELIEIKNYYSLKIKSI